MKALQSQRFYINKTTFEISKGNKIILYVPINSATETSAREGLGDVENVIIKEYK